MAFTPSVNINITSVAGYLPPSNEDNDAMFAGLTSRPQGLPSSTLSLTPAQEAVLRARQIDVQMKDAVARNVVWGVEGDEDDPDADGEPDEGYVLTADGTYERRSVDDNLPAPIGLRNQGGSIVPLPLEKGCEGQATSASGEHIDSAMDVDIVTQSEALFEGLSEPVPTRVGELVSSARFPFAEVTDVQGENLQKVPEVQLLDQTQQICRTQQLEDNAVTPIPSRRGSPMPNSITDAFASINITSGVDLRHQSRAASRQILDIDTQILHNIAMNPTNTYSRSQSDDISRRSMSSFGKVS